MRKSEQNHHFNILYEIALRKQAKLCTSDGIYCYIFSFLKFHQYIYPKHIIYKHPNLPWQKNKLQKKVNKLKLHSPSKKSDEDENKDSSNQRILEGSNKNSQRDEEKLP